jgi:diguanylate cyclase (GGDEF)-like protein
MDNDNMNGFVNAETAKTNKNINSILFFRWLSLFIVSVIYFFDSEVKTGIDIFLETIAIAIVYNIVVTSNTLRSFRSNSKNNKAYIIIYLDIVLISIFSFQTGGINSDMYILLLFLIGYCGILSNKANTNKVGIFCVILYTISSFFSAKSNHEELPIWGLALRCFFLIAASYGISKLNHEVKKYGEMHKKEFKLARTDKLTGLANRHYFDQKLKDEADYADSSGKPLNILMFDLDNFKRFNDSYGHVWGDKLLILFSDIIKQNIRKTDIPVRYGGEEFLLLIRDLDIQMALEVGDRIRRHLEKQKIYIGNEDDKKKVTVSCGVAQYPRHSANIKQAIDYADKALYHAKEIGKNVAVSFEDIKNNI